VSIYETDEEKVEAIKKWWKDNGLSVVAGVVIGLGAVFGWRWWGQYEDSVAQEASAAFEELMATAEVPGGEAPQAKAGAIADAYASTAYAALAALMKARVAVEAGDTAAARLALEEAIAKAPDPALARVAALRLARVLLAESNLDEARAVLDRHEDAGPFSGDFAAVRGDIAAAAGRTAEAREAYAAALAAGTANPELVQLKLDNLPPAG
jgi:predicted negative regulator of RcsB-dependent stress response